MERAGERHAGSEGPGPVADPGQVPQVPDPPAAGRASGVQLHRPTPRLAGWPWAAARAGRQRPRHPTALRFDAVVAGREVGRQRAINPHAATVLQRDEGRSHCRKRPVEPHRDERQGVAAWIRTIPSAHGRHHGVDGGLGHLASHAGGVDVGPGDPPGFRVSGPGAGSGGPRLGARSGGLGVPGRRCARR